MATAAMPTAEGVKLTQAERLADAKESAHRIEKYLLLEVHGAEADSDDLKHARRMLELATGLRRMLDNRRT
jgi:hypothetical protein